MRHLQINEEAMAAFVDGGGVPTDKYKRAVSRVPLPLKFDDAAQVRKPYKYGSCVHVVVCVVVFGVVW